MNEQTHDVLEEPVAESQQPQEEKPDEKPEGTPEEPGSDPDVEQLAAQVEGLAQESGSDSQAAGELVEADGQPAAELDIPHVKRVMEAALLATTEPLTVQQLKRLFSGQVDADTIRKLLDEMRGEWEGRSIELTAVASGWRFRVKPEFQPHIDRISNEKPPRYSRAVLETLAIIAYRQPVTRGDIEEVRGVAVSPATLKALEERGWVEVVGHRETPGRPALFATTRKFLDDLNLRSLEELPALEELQSALEPAPMLAGLEAAPPPQQDSLIADEPLPEETAEDTAAQPEQDAQTQEPDSHAG